MTTRNSAASVRARLLNKARAQGVDFQVLLTRYGLERLLYRLSVSRERDNLLLKGALLFDLWYERFYHIRILNNKHTINIISTSR